MRWPWGQPEWQSWFRRLGSFVIINKRENNINIPYNLTSHLTSLFCPKSFIGMPAIVNSCELINQSMDIFKDSKRRKEQTTQKPYQYKLKNSGAFDAINEQQYDEKLQKQLAQSFNTEYKQFETYLHNEYRLFDYKVNRCVYDCFKGAKNHKDMDQCREKCEKGSIKFTEFSKGLLEGMMENMQTCLETASKNPNSYQESVRCYEALVATFKNVKAQIKEEARYYV